MLDTELIREHHHLEDIAWSLIERQQVAHHRTYEALAARLSEIDARMAEIERSVPASVLYAD